MRLARRLGCAALAAALGGEASAAAWTRPPGETFVSAAVGRFATDDGGYAETTVAVYGERGVIERLTAGGSVELVRPDDDAEDETTTGSALIDDTLDANLSGFLRWRLREGAAGDPLSVQAGFAAPLGDTLGAGPAQTRDEPAVDLRLLYGRGVSTGWGPGFANLEAGPRFRLEESADELRLDLTAGLRPAEGWLLMAQAFLTLGLGNADPGGDDYDLLKVAPAVGRELAPGVTVLLGLERDVAGRNVDEGTRLRLSVWTEF